MSDEKTIAEQKALSGRDNLRVILQLLMRNRKLLVVCALIGGFISFANALIQPDQYSSQTSLLFRDPAFDQRLFGSSSFKWNTDPGRDAATNIKLVTLDTVATRTAQKLGGSFTPGQIKSMISVAGAGQSDVVNISAVAGDPRVAAKVANTFANQYVLFRRSADQDKVLSARAQVTQQAADLRSKGQLAEAATLEKQIQNLGVLAALQTGNAEIVQPAGPASAPFAPTPFKSGVIGGIVGLIVGLVAIFIRQRLDTRFRNVEDVEDALGLPVLGVLPESEVFGSLSREKWSAASGELEGVRMLRTRIRYFNVDREIKTLLVTSSEPGDGKSTVSWFLAAVAAATGQRVLLLECDLRKPTLMACLNLDPLATSGLVSVLSEGTPWSLAVTSVPLPGSAPLGGEDRVVDIIPAGGTPPNPAEMLESRAMQQLIDQVRDAYDLIVVDAPPSLVAEVMPMTGNVDGVLAVLRIGVTHTDAIKRMVDQFRKGGAPLLGTVANGVSKQSGTYGYGYGYGYYGRPEDLAIQATKAQSSDDLESASGSPKEI